MSSTEVRSILPWTKEANIKSNSFATIRLEAPNGSQFSQYFRFGTGKDFAIDQKQNKKVFVTAMDISYDNEYAEVTFFNAEDKDVNVLLQSYHP